MACSTWEELIKEYRLSVQAYSDAVDLFNGNWGSIDRKRTRAERAMEALRQHEHRHGCQRTAVETDNRGAGLHLISR